MAYEQKDNSGALFRNDKGDNESRPNYRGDCMVEGIPKRMAAWVKEGKNGKFLSIKFEAPRERQEPAQTQADLDDEIPF